MDYELKNKLVKIISKNILTPVIYMIENDNLLDFICFCDRNIKMQEIYNVEQQIKEYLRSVSVNNVVCETIETTLTSVFWSV